MDSVKVGAFGSRTEGEAWSFEAEGGGGITNIIARHSEVVDAIQFVAKTPDGRTQTSPQFGGKGGNETKVVLNWPTEYVTAISGTYEKYFNVPDVVKSLVLTTNQGRKFEFGRPRGTPFALTIEKGAVVGFHGRNTQYLNAIGLFVRP